MDSVDEAGEWLSDKKEAKAFLGNVLVLGLGTTGQAVVSYLAENSCRVSGITIATGASTDAARSFLEGLTCEVPPHVLFDCTSVEGSFDLCVASPGIPFWSDLYQSALSCSTELIGEVEFAWRESSKESTWIAITGTNGKTTVTSLCAHVLRVAGRRAKAVGNIGDTCLEAVQNARTDGTDVFVAETSSYQLASTVRFAPEAAVLLNITPDHIHWHGSLDAYRDAKFKLIDNLRGKNGACAVLDACNEVVRAQVARLRKLQGTSEELDYIPLGSADGLMGDMRARCKSRNAAFADEQGMLRIAYDGKERALCSADDLQIKGLHNISNALAAASVALALGCDDEKVVAGLKSFAPLEHRMEPCSTVKGVRCYNDSKATNVDATLKALSSFKDRRLVVLLGGQDKGTDLEELVDLTRKQARIAVIFGEAAERFEGAFEQAGCLRLREGETPAADSFVFTHAAHLSEAFELALRLCESNDALLLSPACASFDEFSSFEHRGRVFKDLVERSRVEFGA